MGRGQSTRGASLRSLTGSRRSCSNVQTPDQSWERSHRVLMGRASLREPPSLLMRRNLCGRMTVQASRLRRMMTHSLDEAPLWQVLELGLKRLLEHTVRSSTTFLVDEICNLC